jgi:hypothetical protein
MTFTATFQVQSVDPSNDSPGVEVVASQVGDTQMRHATLRFQIPSGSALRVPSPGDTIYANGWIQEGSPGQPPGTEGIERTSVTDSPDEADDEPTRDELYERAKELDIQGRSDMNKDELAAAVEDAAQET